jgi:hypothetical protein
MPKLIITPCAALHTNTLLAELGPGNVRTSPLFS